MAWPKDRKGILSVLNASVDGEEDAKNGYWSQFEATSRLEPRRTSKEVNR